MIRDQRDPQKVGEALLIELAAIRQDHLAKRRGYIPAVASGAAENLPAYFIEDFDDSQAGPMCGLPPEDA